MLWYQKHLQNVWNIPNALTILRLLLIPVFMVLYYTDHLISAMVVFVIASLTDILDGYLARKLNQITAFGKLMDPLADKIMVITVMLTRVVSGSVPIAVLCILAAKELIMVLGGWILVKYKDIVVCASPIGKVAQFTFCVGLALTFLHDRFLSWPFSPDSVVIWLAVALTLVALVHYSVDVYRTLKGKKTI